MIERYEGSEAKRIWSEEHQIGLWLEVTMAYARDAIGLLNLEDDKTRRWHRQRLSLHHEWHSERLPTLVAMTRRAELDLGHEVVAFLSVLESTSPDIKKYLHLGLTSSDLTEYALHQSCWAHAKSMHAELRFLNELLNWREAEHRTTWRAGRTHGQLAAVTTLGHQYGYFAQWASHVLGCFESLDFPPVKTPGPVGNGPREVPLVLKASSRLATSTQVIPRAYLLSWVQAYQQLVNLCDSIATWVRLGCREEVGEFVEGDASGRVGSSAMPGKKNPIGAERICGLARVARGHIAALGEVSGLWEDRDLTNSSTERVSVPDLAHLTERILTDTGNLLRGLQINTKRMEANRQSPRCTAHIRQYDLQATHGLGPVEASNRARKEMENGQPDTANS